VLVIKRLWSWHKSDIEFVTPLSLDRCQEQLAKALAYERGWFGIPPEKPVMGEIHDNEFYLAQTPTFYQDTFRPFLYGRLVAISHGTLVQASFRLHTAIIIVLAFMVVFPLGGGVLEVLAGRAVWWGTCLFLSCFWGVMALFVWLGSWSKKSIQDYLANYLRAVLIPSGDHP
jgi:hypothetical protein